MEPEAHSRHPHENGDADSQIVQAVVEAKDSEMMMPGNHSSKYKHYPKSPSKVKSGERQLAVEEREGLFNARAICFLILWYIFSFCTLFLNKYILSTLRGDPTLLGK